MDICTDVVLLHTKEVYSGTQNQEGSDYQKMEQIVNI